MRIVVAGASGLIGAPLVAALRKAGHDVDVLVRREPRAAGEFAWNPDAGELDPHALEGADAVINLSGASIARIPWTNGYRREPRG
jgi:NAD dependent epimerase/dehydratase family enzyme